MEDASGQFVFGLEVESGAAAECLDEGESVMRGHVAIEFTEDQALVLYDLVSRLGARDDLMVEDQAELRVLWDLESELESRLESVLAGDYRDRLVAAREQVRDVDE